GPLNIKAVLFDADGVVIFPWRFAGYLEREHGITRAMTREFFHGVFNNCLVGKAELREVLPSFLSNWGWKASVQDFIVVWLETENAPDPRILEAVRSLRQAGYLCGLATSQERCRAEYMTKQMGFAQAFDWLFFSCDLGCQKPDPDYYQKVTDELGLNATEILFFDDLPDNVAAARACGWNAEVYADFESFEEKLADYLIKNQF
ncbi:MAG TPA: HAD-IA family hydrolase, partial [Anaerolineales bacterium]